MKNFDELNLIDPLCRAIIEQKYETPTEIQARTIPPAIAQRDVLGCARTGTGKTAAFALPILHRLGRNNRKSVPHSPHALVLAPTRELAVQIGESFATYGRHLRVKHALVYGGVSQANQVRVLKRGAHVVVATPGRLIDLMNQSHVNLDRLEVFVLDEADRMMDMGFLPDIKRVIAELPKRRQSLFFSATMPPKIVQLSRQLLNDPVSVTVTPERNAVEQIEQRVMFVERSGKKALLQKVLHSDGVDRTLVFAKTKRGANQLAKRLVSDGIPATAIHGNKSQAARQRALDEFRRNRVTVLVATDVAARGIDVDGITHVVNYELPLEPENYIHRIGRTGRAGASGVALSFCSSDERSLLRNIERAIGRTLSVDPDHPQLTGSESPAMRKPAAGAQQRTRPRRKNRPGYAKTDSKQTSGRKRRRRNGQKHSTANTQRSGSHSSSSHG